MALKFTWHISTKYLFQVEILKKTWDLLWMKNRRTCPGQCRCQCCISLMVAPSPTYRREPSTKDNSRREKNSPVMKRAKGNRICVIERTRTSASEEIWFLVKRLNHSATMTSRISCHQIAQNGNTIVAKCLESCFGKLQINPFHPIFALYEMKKWHRLALSASLHQ